MRILKSALEPVMNWSLLFVMLSAMGVLSTRNAIRTSRSSAADITADPRVRQALAKLASEAEAGTGEQIRLTEIPAPTFREYLRETHPVTARNHAGPRRHTDQAGNL